MRSKRLAEESGLQGFWAILESSVNFLREYERLEDSEQRSGMIGLLF